MLESVYLVQVAPNSSKRNANRTTAGGFSHFLLTSRQAGATRGANRATQAICEGRTDADERRGATREGEAPRERIASLIAAILRISASLDLGTVLREVVDSARALTGARYGVITPVDEAGLPARLRHFRA